MPIAASSSDALVIQPVVAKTSFDWFATYENLPCQGLVRSIASYCQLISASDNKIMLRLDESRSALYSDKLRMELQSALSELLMREIDLHIEVAALEVSGESAQQKETPYIRQRRLQRELQQKRLNRFYTHSGIKAILDGFDASLDENSLGECEHGST